jgi:hypothetical protein
VAEAERTIIAAAVEESFTRSLAKPKAGERVAKFYGVIPDAGIKTSKNNEWVITMHVAWANRHEVARLIDQLPFEMLVTVESVGPDAD